MPHKTMLWKMSKLRDMFDVVTEKQKKTTFLQLSYFGLLTIKETSQGYYTVKP